MQLSIMWGTSRIPSHYILQLLDGRNQYIPFIGLQFFDQIFGIIGFIDIDGVVLSIGFEGIRRLIVQITAVDDENDLLHTGNLGQIMGNLIGGQSLAGTCRMPDITRVRPVSGVWIDGIPDGFNRMNLIGTQHDEGFPFTVEYRILGYHSMSGRNG